MGDHPILEMMPYMAIGEASSIGAQGVSFFGLSKKIFKHNLGAMPGFEELESRQALRMARSAGGFKRGFGNRFKIFGRKAAAERRAALSKFAQKEGIKNLSASELRLAEGYSREPGIFKGALGKTTSKAGEVIRSDALKASIEGFETGVFGEGAVATTRKAMVKGLGEKLGSTVAGYTTTAAGIGKLAGGFAAVLFGMDFAQLGFGVGSAIAQSAIQKSKNKKYSTYGNKMMGIQSAATMRRASMMALGNSGMGNRSLIGHESSIVHE